MNTQAQISSSAAVSPALIPAVARHAGRPEGHNAVEAPSRTSAKVDLTMLRVRIVRVFTTFLLLASIAVLGGCSKKEEAAVTPPRPQPASQPASQPAPTTSSSAPPSTQGEFPGLTLTIQELKRSSNALTLKFVLQSKGGMAFASEFGEGNEFGNIGGIHLIDAANKKKYFVMRDTDGSCVCSQHIANIAAGSQSVLWAKFPAPPDDVQKITVEIPHFPPFEDVPISR
jgi:hypothetical protein